MLRQWLVQMKLDLTLLLPCHYLAQHSFENSLQIVDLN